MSIRKHTLAIGIALAIAASGTTVAIGQGMPNAQPGQGSGMMGGSQGSMGPGMMDGMGPGMMGSQGGMRPGIMGGMGPGMMGGGMRPCPMMGGAGMGMMQGMLEPEQRAEMRELMHAHRPSQFERMGQMMNLRDDLMAEMHSERPDPEEVQALHGRMAEIHGQMMVEMVRMRNAMHDLMTDEQRQQLQQATPAPSVDPDDHDVHH